MNQIIEAFLVGISLCGDCLAVSLCSSVAIDKVRKSMALKASLVFAIVQSGLLMLGWALTDMLVRLLADKISNFETIAHWAGFLLLLYVGVSMIIDALKKDKECRDLNGFRNLMIGAVATSIDAFVVGISMSLNGNTSGAMWLYFGAVFICTMISVIVGMYCGSAIGRRFGRTAGIVGGVILILLGVNIIFPFFG
jgi:putative Mn2+ efflux pump MntP